MSLNNIELNQRQLAELYKRSLVIVGNTIMEPGIEPPSDKRVPEAKNVPNDEAIVANSTNWKFLGENKRNILLLVRYPEATHLPDEELNFLTSILSACKLSLAEVAILNIAKAPATSYKDIFDHFKSRTIVLLGITPIDFGMPVNFPEFQVQGFNNCTFLCAPGLEKLMADKVLKSKLWVCLRKMFDV